MDDRKKILEMVANKIITPDEAAKLLEAMNPTPQKEKIYKGKRIHIEIKQDNRKKPLLNLSIPINIAKLGLKFFPKNGNFNASVSDSNFDFSSVDWKQILEMAKMGEIGELFYMEVDEDDGSSTTIRIYID